MKTLAVSFGDGRYLEHANAAIKRFSRLNDVEGLVLDIEKLPVGLDHPVWAKAWIWDLVPADVDRIIWLDADVVPVRSIMDVVPDFPVPFCAVRDAGAGRQQAEWDNAAVKDLDRYFNSGVFVAHRETEPMFKEWQAGAMTGELHPFWDQTPLSLLLAKHLTPGQIFDLPRECNWLTGFGPAPTDVRMMHFAGWPDELRHDVLRVIALLDSEPVQGDRTERGDLCVTVW